MSIDHPDSVNTISALPEPFSPKILKATGAGDRLDFNNMYSDNELIVQVPHYTGMARGHTVRLTWENPRHLHHSAVITVGTPGSINVGIPRMEVIDAIGHSVKVYYTVREVRGAPLIYSKSQLLHITPYQFDLLEPTLSSDEKTLSVNYVGMVTGYTVRIRAVGKTTWDSDERAVSTGEIPTFILPTAWREENDRVSVFFNYSVYKSGSHARLLFSKVLRKTIDEVIKPELLISSVRSLPSNNEVPEGGTTSETTLVLRGRAQGGQNIELREKGAFVATIAVAASGDWSHTISATAGSYSYTIKALYGSGSVSAPPRTLTVAALFTPSITQVTDSRGTINRGGTTYDTRVIASGDAPRREQLQIYNNGAPVGSAVTVPADGRWSASISGLSIRSHSLIARALYTVSPIDSGPYNFSVIQVPPPPLAIPQGAMILDGMKLLQNYGWSSLEVARNSETRQATGGRPPYIYSSSNSAVASVTSTGLVRGMKNGEARITVTDSSGSPSVGYTVRVSNIFRVQINDTYFNYNDATNWIASVGGIGFNNYDHFLVALRAIRGNFSNPFQIIGQASYAASRFVGRISNFHAGAFGIAGIAPGSTMLDGGVAYPGQGPFRCMALIPN